MLCAKIDEFPTASRWTVEHVKTLLLLGFVHFDDIAKMRGCYLMTKEDDSVFVTPNIDVSDDDDSDQAPSKRQWMLDQDYAGFAFAPSAVMQQYVQNKKDRDVATTTLFCHMTNFVAANHGWHHGCDLVPSNYLDIAISPDQVNLLNPTPRDIQIGAILDQCAGVNATKSIAKRRVEMISGNINSYARILKWPSSVAG